MAQCPRKATAWPVVVRLGRGGHNKKRIPTVRGQEARRQGAGVRRWAPGETNVGYHNHREAQVDQERCSFIQLDGPGMRQSVGVRHLS